MSEEPRVAESQNRGAAECGLASLLLGGFLAIMAMLSLQINLQMYLGTKAWSQNDLRPIAYAAVAGAVVLAVLLGTSLALAVRSLLLARRNGQSSALGWAGLLLTVPALLLWVGALVDLFAVLEMLERTSPWGVPLRF